MLALKIAIGLILFFAVVSVFPYILETVGHVVRQALIATGLIRKQQ